MIRRGVLLATILFPAICGGQEPADQAKEAGPQLPIERVEATLRPDWQLAELPETISGTRQIFEERGRVIHRFRLNNRGRHRMVTITADRPASRLHDEFVASVRLHSTNGGIQLALRVVLPHQKDPRTSEPLVTLVSGSVYQKDGSWQMLRAMGTSAAMESQLRRLRVELHRSDVNIRQAYIDGLVLLVEAGPGDTFLDIAETEYGPVVADSALPVRAEPSPELPQETATSGARYIPLRVELNHVLLNGVPAVLRLAPDHGETINTLRQLGLNAAWIPDCRDFERAEEMREAGLAVLATPPQPTFEPGDYNHVLQGLPPLDQLCPGVSAWLLGTRVSPDQLPHFLAISRETRSADREFRRPQMADVTAAEGAASREVELVGIGRHVVGRDDNFGQLRNQTFRRQRGAGQLSFPWMWIQTEPSGQQQAWRQRTGTLLPHVEPEQITAQVYAAVSAGCRGIGYWKTRPLQPENELDQEIMDAIELVNLELTLLEPLLARGRVDGHLRIQNSDSHAADHGRRTLPNSRPQPWIQSALSSAQLSAGTMVHEEPDGPDATVITSGGSMLILVNHWDTYSQYVPSPVYSKEITLVVAASETASAWQLSTTGVRALRQEVTAGGLKLRIQDFDRHAAVLITSDPDLVRQLEQRIYQVAERSSQLVVQLASLKYARVLNTTEELQEQIQLPADAQQLFRATRQFLDRAQLELKQRDFSEATSFGRSAMRTLRQIQYLCWRQAVAGMVSPSAAPHTVSFNTLPDHWSMQQQIRSRSDTETPNLLRRENFEDWQKAETRSSGYLCTADVLAEPGSPQSVLRLAAWVPGSQQNSVHPRDSETPLVVTSPAVAVSEGDIVRITGRIRKGRVVPPISRRPVLLFDSEMGPECGVQLAVESEWKGFEILRQIGPQSSSFRFSIALTSVAEVHVEGLSISRLPAVPEPASTGSMRLTGQIRSDQTQPEQPAQPAPSQR